MKVRRKSPILEAVPASTGFIRYKGKLVEVPCKYILKHSNGDVPISSLDGFQVIQENPLLVQQIWPIEEAVQWNKHGDHKSVRQVKHTDLFHAELLANGKNPEDHGIMVNHAGHDNDISPGDHIVGNPGSEIRRLKKDMIHYEVIEE